MNEISKPSSPMGPIPATILSVVVAGLLGLAAGSKVDELVRPMLGTAGAVVAGFGTALLVLVGFGIVSYRSLTR